MDRSAAGPPRHLVLVGPTASGKSALALAAARAVGDAEIVSVDSMAVYQGMDLGTAKPSASERAEIRHHLLDLVEPDEEYSVARFQADAASALADIEARGRRAILVGGTGLYLDAVVDGLTLPGQYPEVRAALADRAVSDLYRELVAVDPVAAARMEPTNRRRIERALEVCLGSGRPFSSYGPGLQAARTPDRRFVLVGLRMPRDVLAGRIADRYRAQLAAGFVAEVRGLWDRYGERMSRTARQALGYREILAFVRGETTLEDAVAEAQRRTVAFAKRQERWFRRDPRVAWVERADEDSSPRLPISPELVTPLLARWTSSSTDASPDPS